MAIFVNKATLQVTSVPQPDVETSQFFVTAVANIPSAALELSGMFVTALTSAPAAETLNSDLFVTALTGTAPKVETSQLFITMIACGRTDDPQVRVWTFTLDGHDFYVIRLGTAETLVYDLYADQWYVWASGTGNIWNVYTGINWQGGSIFAQSFGTNIIVGSDANGSLFFLDPDNSYDDDTVEGAARPREFQRELTGQVATRSIDLIPCFGVQLMGSVGEMEESGLTAVTLLTSDDQGNTYDSQGTLEIANQDFDARVDWRSLGSFGAPGRLFKIQDTGVLHRIDFLEMLEDGE